MKTPETPPRSNASEVVDAVRSLAFEAQHFVDETARGLGLHRTDLEAIGLIIDAGRHDERLTPGQLSHHAGLSAAAVSALIDRLAQAGHATRTRHEKDGRRVFIDVTPEAREMSRVAFSPLNRHMFECLERYSEDELAVAARVIEDLAAAARASARLDSRERPLAP